MAEELIHATIGMVIGCITAGLIVWVLLCIFKINQED